MDSLAYRSLFPSFYSSILASPSTTPSTLPSKESKTLVASTSSFTPPSLYTFFAPSSTHPPSCDPPSTLPPSSSPAWLLPWYPLLPLHRDSLLSRSELPSISSRQSVEPRVAQCAQTGRLNVRLLAERFRRRLPLALLAVALSAERS